VTDVVREVDEEVRREQLKKLWERYQYLVYGVVFLIVFGVGGWRVYEWYETRRATETGTRFEMALEQSDDGKYDEAERGFARVAADGSTGYRSLARLREASELARRDPAAGAASYRQAAGDSSLDPALREVAALRAATLMIDQNSLDEARKLLEPLAEAGKSFRHSARELLAIAAWRSGDMTVLRRWYAQMITDPDTPPATRGRVEMLLSLAPTIESKS
jgi:hypothetical protein